MASLGIEMTDDTQSERVRMTGAEMVIAYAIRKGVRFAAGIPGHGSWAISDALLDHVTEIRGIQAMHEQSAVHIADGHYRASGRPMLSFTSVGPGAANTAVGVATAFADSTALLLVTGSPLSDMRGHSVLQEFDRTHGADFPRLLEPVVKEWWQPSHLEEIPFVLHRAWNQMLCGRPGPVLIDLALDLQADSAPVILPDPDEREARSRPRPAADDVERAAALLRAAKRPVIVAGGGVIGADATAELQAVAERLGAAVVTTWNGKGAIDETHTLHAGGIGDTATTSGNRIAAEADVILAVGCRFTDWSSSSFRRGITFAIPPTRLIHLDIDPREIGKNYPVEVALVADAREGLRDLITALGPGGGTKTFMASDFFATVQSKKDEWEAIRQVKAMSDAVPMTQFRAVTEIQRAVDEDAIVVTGAGIVQGAVRQNWISRLPRTHITSGGFSTMGFTVPAAIGAALAQPGRQVIGIAGDGDFLQTMQELAAAVMADVPIVIVILDNQGWISIKFGQTNTFGRATMVDFLRPDGSLYRIDYQAIGAAFGIPAAHVTQPSDVAPAIRVALASGGPALVAIDVARDFPDAALERTGWWDVPVPERHAERRAANQAARAEEQHLG